ncbi:MAG: hypothetical protein GY739_12280 [Mesoflavibacter sp.]|nr:hypothetical protein [Mesoflavibacter sp.]
MMSEVDLEAETKQMLWAEAISMATRLNNYVVNKPNEIESSYVRFFNKEPPHLDYLRTFGTVAYVTKRNTKSKYESKSTKCIMVGYAEDHAPDCYRFLNLETRKIIQSRDVMWTEELNGKESDEEIQETEVESDAEDQIVRPPYVESGEATSERIIPCIDQLQNLMAVEENIKGAIIPTTYEKAVKEVRWKDAMIKELPNIEQRYVWEKMKLIELPPNCEMLWNKMGLYRQRIIQI